MGSGSSSTTRQKDLGKSQHAIVQLMMPIYFDSVDCTLDEHKMAEDCWNLVLTDKAPEYLARKEHKSFQYSSCVTFFYDNFYVRLFDVHPASKELFKSGMRGQGKFLVMMLSLALSELKNPAQFDKSLLKLADIHYKRVPDGVVGDVLFWTLRRVMGEAYYTVDLHRAWVKIYSRMLKTLVPAGVGHEMRSDDGCTVKRDMTSMFTEGGGGQSCSYALLGGADDKSMTDRLDSQKMLDEHREASVQLRSASKVDSPILENYSGVFSAEVTTVRNKFNTHILHEILQSSSINIVMGSGSSTAAHHKNLGKSQHAIVQLMMPIYFDSVDCTLDEHKLAEQCWNLVLTDKAPEYLSRVGTKGFQYTSCVTFFYDNFYVRLFDVHPASKELFKSGMKGQGKFLVMMLSLALSELSNPVQFDKSLLKLADIHYKRDGVVGDVLFWTLRKVMGEAYYTVELHQAWVKIYSRMLKTLVPAGVGHEMKGEDGCTVKRDMTSMFTEGGGGQSCSHAAAGAGFDTDEENTVSMHLDSQKILNSHRETKGQLMMPIYFDSVDCTLDEHKMTEQCWNLVLTDKAPEYLARLGTADFQYTSCVSFFYDNFYVRLFDVHPASKELFKSGMKGQGKFLVMMLSLALSELSNPAQFDKSLLKLAEIHYKRGVKAVEYGVVGDVLFWTLRKVMGEAHYTVELHKAWVKIYSRMLKTLVPAGVSHELKGGDDGCTVKRDMTSMFTEGAESSASVGFGDGDRSVSLRLDSQKILNHHREKSVQARPASTV